ncbi:MAG: hypothetical protein KKH02_13655 [Proteobacteria bacterium]|nr:hypothetical protein [Pseudomonadota bacterium]MBU4583433.1 hypothetical protein [Pseudomonadota bacterium]MCG2740849.1 hypothetical protein [Syntrophaceae bacterium]
MKVTLDTILKVLTRRAAGILDGVLTAILLAQFPAISSISIIQVSRTKFGMLLMLILSILFALLTAYILLYKRLKLVSVYLKIQGTSWETVEDTVEFSNAFDDALAKEKR